MLTVRRLELFAFFVLACIVTYVTACTDTSYTVTVRKSTDYYTGCGFLGWSRCKRTRYYTGYSTVNCPSTTGTWGSWTGYTSCTKSCAGGTRQRTRTCGSSTISQCCAKCAGEKTQTQTENCNTHNCPVHGGWTGYSDWSVCSVPCGGGTQTRGRSCTNPAPNYGGNNCVGSATESRTCNTQNCPIHGGWSDYSEWSTCTEECGGGTQSRDRSCTNPTPQYGGKDCDGSATESRTCNTHNCPIHGDWSDYSEWSTCTEECGGGTQSRDRSCTNPTPQYGGKDCDGSATESRTCNTHNCPINGGWSDYSEWSICSAKCGGGTQSRIRKCTNPAPQYGGNDCVGSGTETQTCNTQHCPINGVWSDWNIGQWDSCPYTCVDEIQNRTDIRYCNNPAPQYGGEECKGASSRKLSQTCLEQKCPVHGGWSDWNAWSTWGECSTSCDQGIKYRNRERTCTKPEPLNGGNECPGNKNEVDSTSCMLFQCPSTVCGAEPGEHHKHPDPQKCNMFLNCGQHGETYEQACQSGLAWNQDLNACDQSSAKDCLGTCSHGQYEKHPTNCSMYYHCDSGTKIAKACDEGKRWNDIIQNCDHAENVECLSEEESDDDAGDVVISQPTCACNATDTSTSQMCKTWPNPEGCEPCVFGKRYAHDVDNCRYHYFCNYYLIRMDNPPGQYWQKTDEVFQLKASECS